LLSAVDCAQLIAAPSNDQGGAFLCRRRHYRIFGAVVKLQDGSSLLADLTTIGRKTGAERTVKLRFVFYRGCFYASSSRIKGKHWCENMLKNPAVKIRAGTVGFSGTARQVTDETLRRHILALRGSPADMSRVVFEIRPAAVG
jgi:deazaflavin-dependent oxidoreductase (nitroreductase family)